MVTITPQLSHALKRLTDLENASRELEATRSNVFIALNDTKAAMITNTAFKTAHEALQAEIKLERENYDLLTLAYHDVTRALDVFGRGYNPLADKLAAYYCHGAGEVAKNETITADYVNACKQAGELLDLCGFLIAVLTSRGQFIPSASGAGEFFTVEGGEHLTTPTIEGYLIY